MFWSQLLLVLPPVSLWQNSCHWILGRSSPGRSLPLWLARPFGWSLWTRDPPGTRSCAVPEVSCHGPGPGEAVSPGCAPDCQLGCAPPSPVCFRTHPGGWWALWGSSWNHQSPGAERQVDSSRPWLFFFWRGGCRRGVSWTPEKRQKKEDEIEEGHRVGRLFCWLVLTLLTRKSQMTVSFREKAGAVECVLIYGQSASKYSCQSPVLCLRLDIITPPTKKHVTPRLTQSINCVWKSLW